MRIVPLPVLGMGWMLFVAVSAACQAPSESEIPKYLEVNTRVGTGGQPTAKGIELLKGLGYEVVVNLRTENEGVDISADKDRVVGMGMKYVHIPVDGSAPSNAKAEEFLKLMREHGEQRVFVHCASANRVGAFMLLHDVLNAGMSVQEAEKEADRIGLRSERLRQFAKEYVTRHKK